MIKVLIVEDEENILKGIQYMVNWNKCGSTVVGTAWNGEEGIKMIKNLKPDIVITDVRMPFVDGLEMIEAAQKFHDFESIIISGYNSFDYAKTAIHLDVTNYILKPIDYKEVEETLIKLKENISNRRSNIVEKHTVFYSQKMKEIIEYIDEHISERLTLSSLCDVFHVSTTTLNNLFKKEVNTTVNDYINSAKINKSIDLIKSEKYLVYEVAEMLGYNDYKYFSKVFKKYTDKSPSEFISDHQTK